jgi:uncharacterized membrane protein YphA (DoxX/SURF4 family)
MQAKQIAKEVAIWVLTIALVLMFGNAGIRKFFEHGGWTRMFHNLGFPDWFRILIGVLETAAAALLLVPRTAAYGAAVVIPIMIGAIVTMAMHGWTRSLPQPSITLVFVIIILIARWRRRMVITRGLPLAPQQ